MKIGKIIAVPLVLLIILILAFSCFTSVPAGFTGVPVTFGKVADYTLDSGFHFVSPVTTVIKMDNRIQKHTVVLSAFSKDIQETNVTYTINYQISKNDAMTIYRTIGKEYFDTVISPNISEAVKTATAHYTAESLVNNRDKLAAEIEEILTNLLNKYNIVIVGTSIEDLDFTDAFTNAVEAKQVAQQDKLRAQTVAEQQVIEAKAAADVKRVEAEASADAKKTAAEAEAYEIQIKAEAEAEANKKINSSISEVLIKYIYANNWDGKYPTTMLGNNTEFLFTPDNFK